MDDVINKQNGSASSDKEGDQPKLTKIDSNSFTSIKLCLRVKTVVKAHTVNVK